MTAKGAHATSFPNQPAEVLVLHRFVPTFAALPVLALFAGCGDTTEAPADDSDAVEADTDRASDSDATSVDDTDAPSASTLFISEFVDHPQNGAVKYVEVANPTGASIDLTDYEVVLFRNGATEADPIQLTGDLAAGDVFVLAAASNGGKTAFESLFSPADMYANAFDINGDDAVGLRKVGTTEVFDVFGVIGVDADEADPPASWYYKDSVARRKTEAAAAVFDVAAWELTGTGTDDGATAATKCTPGRL